MPAHALGRWGRLVDRVAGFGFCFDLEQVFDHGRKFGGRDRETSVAGVRRAGSVYQ
jgi:hypothetical protein